MSDMIWNETIAQVRDELYRRGYGHHMDSEIREAIEWEDPLIDGGRIYYSGDIQRVIESDGTTVMSDYTKVEMIDLTAATSEGREHHGVCRTLSVPVWKFWADDDADGVSGGVAV